MKKNKIACLILSLTLLIGCQTTKDLEKINKYQEASNTASLSEEELQNEEEYGEYLVQDELKVQDVEDTVVYVDRPVYRPESQENADTDYNNALVGYDAAVASQKRATVKPKRYKDGTFYYQYSEDLVYEVYAQPYHLTDIVLEPGEVVQADPLFSEDDAVWELTAGRATDYRTGEPIQHLFIKPAYSKLDSSLIIITDRRVYHLRCISYSDTHMAIVKFQYPRKNNTWVTKDGGTATGRYVENDYVRISNPELLSFDYKIKYSIFKKPEFLPTRVYDDGQATYIQVDDIVLQKKLPVLFDDKNEIINYMVKKNVFVIPRLIDKVTLRLGRKKVTVIKKKSFAKEKDKEE